VHPSPRNNPKMQTGLASAKSPNALGEEGMELANNFYAAKGDQRADRG